ncbi:hypothetical protein BTVI_54823 [Pitangus sulphuratus]|nr:hypothetical protein BTVI_54823 [Pitangus sulphuratus]
MKFKKAKRKVLHLGHNNPRHTSRLGGEVSSPVEKDSGVMADENLSGSGQCMLTAQKANQILGCIKRIVASTLKEVILPLYFALVRLHSWSAASSAGAPSVRRTDIKLLEQVQRKTTKFIRALEHLFYKDRLRKFELFSLEKRRLHGDLIANFHYLKAAYREAREGLFIIRNCSDRTKNNGYILKERKFMSDIRRKLFTGRVVRWYKRLHRDVGIPSLAVFKARLDKALSNLVYWEVSLPMAGGDWE